MWQLSVSVFYDIILLDSLCALSRHLKYVQIIQLLLFGCFIKKIGLFSNFSSQAFSSESNFCFCYIARMFLRKDCYFVPVKIPVKI